ncbi:hypothetical protein GFO_0337 [Christiangramia forsetii KT0803]|uniref:Uncharacterized protein n=1 Tax=Christiangramia forsetii (strain DSM 17595 / CGMCC 1.15422 / KT0803) TaxID=411154 RepID=A0LY78_CHRFK|nr:hypothetical protein GFO_0337 [Christiangramia forsetii KT0803]
MVIISGSHKKKLKQIQLDENEDFQRILIFIQILASL